MYKLGNDERMTTDVRVFWAIWRGIYMSAMPMKEVQLTLYCQKAKQTRVSTGFVCTKLDNSGTNTGRALTTVENV
jgi:hypothetical protein